jgi:hypothetical protein
MGILILFLCMALFFKVVGLLFHVAGKLFGVVLSLLGYIIIGTLAVTLLGLVFEVLPVILVLAIIGIIIAAKKA